MVRLTKLYGLQTSENFSVESLQTTGNAGVVLKFLVRLLHNQYEPKKTDKELKKILGSRRFKPELDQIFQYRETWDWLLLLTRRFISVSNTYYMDDKSINRFLHMVACPPDLPNCPEDLNSLSLLQQLL